MNIFAVDENPRKAAISLCDKHLVKMILESTQILATSLHLHGCPDGDMPRTRTGSAYRPTHSKHPCVIWTAETRSHFCWLIEHALGMCNEYEFRYSSVHSCRQAIEQAETHESRLPFQEPIFKNAYDLCRPWPRAMPKVLRQCNTGQHKYENTVHAYRRYYCHKRLVMTMRWTKRDPPEWFESYHPLLPAEQLHAK